MDKTVKLEMNETKIRAALAAAIASQVDQEVLDKAVKLAINDVLSDTFDWSNHAGKRIRSLADEVTRDHIKDLIKAELLKPENKGRIDTFIRETVNQSLNAKLEDPKYQESLRNRIQQNF